MGRIGAHTLLPLAVAAALLAPPAASAQGWRGDYGHRRPAYGYDAPPPPPPAYRARGYDAPPPPPAYRARGYDAPPPPPGPYRAGYGPRGDRPPPRHYRCDKGTGGTILGAIAGGLLGNGVAGRGDRGLGTIVGAGAGALAGRAIDRDC